MRLRTVILKSVIDGFFILTTSLSWALAFLIIFLLSSFCAHSHPILLQHILACLCKLLSLESLSLSCALSLSTLLPLRKLRSITMERCGKAYLGQKEDFKWRKDLSCHHPFAVVQAIKENIKSEITALEHLDTNNIKALRECHLHSK